MPTVPVPDRGVASDGTGLGKFHHISRNRRNHSDSRLSGALSSGNQLRNKNLFSISCYAGLEQHPFSLGIPLTDRDGDSESVGFERFDPEMAAPAGGTERLVRTTYSHDDFG